MKRLFFIFNHEFFKYDKKRCEATIRVKDMKDKSLTGRFASRF